MPLTANSRYRLVPILLAQAIGMGCGIISVPLNSHLIPPATLGFYGVFLTFAPIGMWVVHAGLIKFVARYWAGAGRRHELAREVLAAWRRRLPWLALLAAGAAAAIGRMGGTGSIVIGLALFFSAGLLALASLAQTALQADGAHWRDCAVTAGSSLSRSFVPPLLYFAVGGGAASLLVGFSVHALAAAAVGGWAVRTLLGSADDPDKSAGRGLTRVYEGPLFVVLAAASWILTGLNRWVIAWCYGETEAGYFTLGGGTAVVLTSMLGTVIIQYLRPGFFALGDGPVALRPTLARRVDLAALGYTLLALALLAGIDAAAPSLVGSLISPDYRPALAWIVPGGCFGIACLTGVFYHTLLLAGQRERDCGPVDLIPAALLVAGCIATAIISPVWFSRWLGFTPLLPWLVTRPLARHYFFKPAASPAPSPVR